jgi:hypothetical protein
MLGFNRTNSQIMLGLLRLNGEARVYLRHVESLGIGKFTYAKQ